MLLAMVKRNLLLYFRDKASVFFSMLGVILIILMYVLFLGQMITNYATGFSGAARFFTDSWVMAGVVASATMTTCLAGFGIMVEDRAKKIAMDFDSAPIRRSTIVLSYVIASVVIGLMMTCLTLVMGEIYIVAYGGELLSPLALIKVLGIVVLSVAASSAFIFFLVATMKSQNAFGTLSSLIGTLIGFLTGTYVPIGNLTAIAPLIKIVPLSHAAAALRQVMVGEVMDIAYIPEADRLFMGIQFKVGDTILSFWAHLAILFATFVLFYGLSVWKLSRYKQKA